MPVITRPPAGCCGAALPGCRRASARRIRLSKIPLAAKSRRFCSPTHAERKLGGRAEALAPQKLSGIRRFRLPGVFGPFRNSNSAAGSPRHFPSDSGYPGSPGFKPSIFSTLTPAITKPARTKPSAPGRAATMPATEIEGPASRGAFCASPAKLA